MAAIFILLLFGQVSFAWSPETISAWDKASISYRPSMITPAFATFWGGFRRGVDFTTNKGSMLLFNLPGFRKEIPVYVQSNHEKRDLVIFYPGVFGKPDGFISPQVIYEIEKNNVHVASIPNLLSPTYLAGRPSSSGDALKSEFANQKIILEQVYKQIGKDNIDRVHVIAESLGSFQALTVHSAAIDKISSLTLLWPPLFLNKAVTRFDDLIKQSQPLLKACSFWWKLPKIVYATKYQGLPEAIDSQDKKCLGYWVIGSSFVDAIKETAVEVLDFKETEVPLTFTEFVAKVTPEIVETMKRQDERLSIEFLLKSFQSSKTKVRIVSSSDDFLNLPEEWEKLKLNRPDLSESIYLFSWGGHSGPVGMDRFIQTLTEQIIKR